MDYSMQNFINTLFYVRCETKEEVELFMVMCEDAGIKKRNGTEPTAGLLPDAGTYVHNLLGSSDGLSYWSSPKADEKREIIMFDEFHPNRAYESFDDLNTIIGI